MTADDGESSLKAERRRRQRVRLQLPVQFHPNGNEGPIACMTRDISSDGFMCLTPRAFQPGETLMCTVTCPSNARSPFDKPFILQCEIRVVRCEYDGDGGFYRTACHIEEYECNHLKAAAAAGG